MYSQTINNGRWTGTTTYGNEQTAVSLHHYNYCFCKDGTFICELTNVPISTNITSTVVEQGTWTLVGDKLALSFVSSNTRYSTGRAFKNKTPLPRSLIIIRRELGVIELRRDVEELRSHLQQRCTDVEAYYDEDGTLHYGARMSNGRSFSSTETAMILKRIKDV